MALSNPINITTEGSGLSDVVGAGAGFAIAAYVAAVALNGNISTLLSQLKQEEGYIEFLIAIVAIWALNKWGPTNEIIDLLTVSVIVGLVLRISSRINLVGITQNFASGQANMLQTAQAIIQGL